MFSSLKTPLKPEHGIALLLSCFILSLTLISQSWNDFILVADQTIQSIPSSANWRNTQLASAEGADTLIALSLMITVWNHSNTIG